jgi:hypothetical protein
MLLSPLLSLIPPRWRGAWLEESPFVGRAGPMSATIEGLLGWGVLVAWYIKNGNSKVLLAIGIYLVTDGIWRGMNARASDESTPTALLLFIDEIYFFTKNMLFARRHPLVDDLVTLDDSTVDRELRVEACRSKREWEVGRIVRYGDRYFRIESTHQVKAQRPFVYELKALEAGVTNPRVIVYSPSQG